MTTHHHSYSLMLYCTAGVAKWLCALSAQFSRPDKGFSLRKLVGITLQTKTWRLSNSQSHRQVSPCMSPSHTLHVAASWRAPTASFLSTPLLANCLCFIEPPSSLLSPHILYVYFQALEVWGLGHGTLLGRILKQHSSSWVLQ